jgi:hypothetical protein
LTLAGIPLNYTKVELAQLLSTFGVIVESRVLYGPSHCRLHVCTALLAVDHNTL